MKKQKAPNNRHTGMARQKRDGSWWFCTRNKSGYRFVWPIGNPSGTPPLRVGQMITVIKRSCQDYCFIPVQMKLFS
jgi:hypothetical protein